MKRKVLVLLNLLLALLLLLSSASFASSSVPVKSISLNTAVLSMAVGKTEILLAKVLPVNATSKALKWSSGSSKIAKVNEKGVVTAVKAGSTTITVKPANGNTSASCRVNVFASLPPVELIMYQDHSPERDEDLVWKEVNKYMKKHFNATVRQITIDWGNYTDKMKVIMSSGEPWDMCFAASWANYIPDNVAKGYFLRLNELLDKYGRNIMEQTPKGNIKALTFKGDILGFCQINSAIAYQGFQFNKTMVDKYKFDVNSVNKLTDLEPYLAAIKKNETEITPWISYHLDSMLSEIWPTLANEPDFIDKLISGLISYDTKANKLVCDWEHPKMKEAVGVLHSWYEKGYIRKDDATINDYPGEWKSGKYGVEYEVNMMPAVKVSGTSAFPTINKPLSNYIRLGASSQLGGIMWGINKNSKNPGRAIMALDFLWQKDGDGNYAFNTICYGIENKHYKVAGTDPFDGRKLVTMIPNSGYAGQTWEYASQFNCWANQGYSAKDNNTLREMLFKGNDSPLLGFWVDLKPIKNENAQLTAVFDTYRRAFSSGMLGPDRLPEFVSKLKEAGLDKVMAEIQKQINQWKKSNNK